jgi:hypothetical protein
MDAHEAFDRLWRSGAMKRKEAYAWLQARMYEGHPIHIGESNEETCRRIVAIVQEARLTPPAKVKA